MEENTHQNIMIAVLIIALITLGLSLWTLKIASTGHHSNPVEETAKVEEPINSTKETNTVNGATDAEDNTTNEATEGNEANEDSD